MPTELVTPTLEMIWTADVAPSAVGSNADNGTVAVVPIKNFDLSEAWLDGQVNCCEFRADDFAANEYIYADWAIAPTVAVANDDNLVFVMEWDAPQELIRCREFYFSFLITNPSSPLWANRFHFVTIDNIKTKRKTAFIPFVANTATMNTPIHEVDNYIDYGTPHDWSQGVTQIRLYISANGNLDAVTNFDNVRFLGLGRYT